MESPRTVRPVEPVAPYLGGKRMLAARLVRRIEAIPHRQYAEVFVGMGGVFLRRRRAPPAEVINDLSGDVSTFFRILQRHYTAFMEMMRFQITTRAAFERLAATDPATLTDLERAARFLYLQNTAFGGKVTGRSFGVSPGLPARFSVNRLGPMLEDLHVRLAGVVIERLPYADFLARYDLADGLFYLDPPYWNGERDYGPGMFVRADFERLAEQLRGIDAAFILSINDVPEIRALFDWAYVDAVDVTYTIAKDTAPRVSELIISNRKPPPPPQAEMFGRR